MVSYTAYLEPAVRRATAGLPEPLRTTFRNVIRSQRMSNGLQALMSRSDEMGDPFRTMLAGVLLDETSRTYLNTQLDKHWLANEKNRRAALKLRYDEVIIGGGVHAAIYCATRAKKAREANVEYYPPLVLEKSLKVGGSFAVSKKPAFFLNSRNRPGLPGIPGENAALNHIPNAPIQTYDICNTEYPDNTVLADVIRVTLAMYAQVVPGIEVTGINVEDPGECIILGEGGRVITRAGRVLLATGLGAQEGSERDVYQSTDKIMGFADFMAKMDEPFPLRDMHRVAVIGSGDSGKTVIETLLGQGPQVGWSIPSLDWVERIDWYGVGAGMTEANWCAITRPRYRNIASAFRANVNDGRRVRPFDQAKFTSGSEAGALVNGTPYDHVIRATGYTKVEIPIEIEGGFVYKRYEVNGLCVGLIMVGGNGLIYKIGPCSSLDYSQAENLTTPVKKIAENITAIFRYGPRTATLAASFLPSLG